MPWLMSQGPRSMPVRTRARGAGTRQAPCRQASHISSQEASKATESPASTRSCGPDRLGLEEDPGLGVDEGGGRAVPDRDAFGRAGGPGGEDDPGVVVGDRLPGGREGPGTAGVRDDRPAGAQDAGNAGLAEHQLGPLVGVVGVHRDVGGARRTAPPGWRRKARWCPRGSGRRSCRRRPARPGAASSRWPGPRPSAGHSSGNGGRRRARRRPGTAAGGIPQDVDQGPLRRRGEGARQLRLIGGAGRGAAAQGNAVGRRLLLDHRRDSPCSR